MTTLRHERFNRLLRPRSIVIVGASEKTGSFGASVLANLEAVAYQHPIYLVNPKRPSINGRPCIASLDLLPKGVECAVLAIPKAGVLEAVRACAARGVGAIITFSAGFAESSAEGKAEQAEIKQLCSDASMVLLGPNCLGIVNAEDGIALTFVSTPPPPPALEQAPRGVAILSQSGAMAAVLGVTFRAHALDLTFSISTGNEAGSGVEDYLEYLLDHERTVVIAILAEQLRQPKRFLSLARTARARGKYIVLLHPGSSKAARASAATHTGAIAGDYEIMRAKVADAGVILVETVEELADVSHLLLRCPIISPEGAVVLTESGAFKALALDLCERVRLPLPELAPQTAAALRKVLPEFIAPSNPLDLTAQGLVDPTLYRRTLPPLLADQGIGSVVLTIILTDAATGALKLPPIIDAIRSLELDKPIIFAGLDEGAWIDPTYVSQLRSLHVPFFPTAERAFRALARVQNAAAPTHAIAADTSIAADRLPSGMMTEFASKQQLKAAGIPVPLGGLARTVEEAIAIAARISYPVVLKAQSELLPHKSEAGGVVLNLRDDRELRQGWLRLHNNLATEASGLLLDGVLVEQFGAHGIELILGARNDPDWGLVLLVGIGGVFAEALQDTRLIVPGSSVEQIDQTLMQLKGAALLRGFRGAPAPDLNAVAEIVQRLGEWLAQHTEVSEVDLNPVMAHPSGAVALDALIVVR